MNNQSIVYGCIKDTIFAATKDQINQHREANAAVMNGLPSIDDWPLISREMFASPVPHSSLGETQTDIVHFGTSYSGIEYEWESWIKHFEKLLGNMYWVSATVHLETEFNGLHTFTWEANDEIHIPNSGEFSCRCEWTRETSFG